MRLTPDEIVILSIGPFVLNATVVATWVLMALLVGLAWLLSRTVSDVAGRGRVRAVVELVVVTIRQQVREVAADDADRYVPFVGTLFLFIAGSSVLGLVPFLRPPTASLSTTTALGLSVLFAVPWFTIRKRGVRAYLATYLRPTPLMLPFNLISEVSRTLALAVRLFGNIMSGTLISAILLSVAPFFFPVLLDLFGLLIGVVQAYVFAVLALVYIASAMQTRDNGATPRIAGSHAPLQEAP